MQESQSSGRRYDQDFKENAVALVRAGRKISHVARDLGVTTWSPGRWVALANAGQTQSRDARAERTAPAQGRERLPAPAARHPKKALGILSAEVPPHATR